MSIVAVGLNHTTAPVEIREQLSFSRAGLTSAFRRLSAYPAVREAVIISTCNRTEIYAVTDGAGVGQEMLTRFLEECRGTGGDVRSHLYVYQDRDAVAHLFRVACGLDSMILGETQVLGQVKEAYLAATDHRFVGATLHNLFEQALRVGKRAHTETAISQNAVSVSYAAVELARKVFSSLNGRVVLIIGAGKMSELTGKHLVAGGVKRVLVANRTRERAEELASRFNGEPVSFSELVRHLALCDIVISSTGAPHTVVTVDMVAEAMRARRQKPLFLVDIAVPRDIEPAVGRLENVFLYDIDDLGSVIKANVKERQREARKVERIVEEETRTFESWLKTRQVVPLIRSLREKVEAIRRREVEKALSRLPNLGQRERAIIEGMTSLIVNKILNDPTVKIKEYANEAEGEIYLRAMTELFNLEGGGTENRPAEGEGHAGREEDGRGSGHQEAVRTAGGGGS